MIKNVIVIMPDDKRVKMDKFEEQEWVFYCSVTVGAGFSVNGKRYTVSDTEHVLEVPTGLMKTFSKSNVSMIIKLSE